MNHMAEFQPHTPVKLTIFLLFRNKMLYLFTIYKQKGKKANN